MLICATFFHHPKWKASFTLVLLSCRGKRAPLWHGRIYVDVVCNHGSRYIFVQKETSFVGHKSVFTNQIGTFLLDLGSLAFRKATLEGTTGTLHSIQGSMESNRANYGKDRRMRQGKTRLFAPGSFTQGRETGHQEDGTFEDSLAPTALLFHGRHFVVQLEGIGEVLVLSLAEQPPSTPFV